jgi:endonuclease-3 related protein
MDPCVLSAHERDPGALLTAIHQVLNAFFGDLGWWPADSPFEVIVGAILTQNTAWRNVERAIAVLKREGVLSPEQLLALSEDRLADWIRPAGYYRVKARRLKAFIRFLYERYEGSLAEMFLEPTACLRERLLAVKGVGPETADSILLYAGRRPVFVVDAYTKRILVRHRIIGDHAEYEAIQRLFMSHLPEDARLFNQYHALLVQTGKTFCRPRARCDGCPLKTIAPS